MRLLIFISGLLVGALATGFVLTSRVTPVDELGIAETVDRPVGPSEAEVLRQIAEDSLVGLEIAVAEEKLREIGVHDVTKGTGEDGTHILLGAGVIVVGKNGVVTHIQGADNRTEDGE